MRARTSLAPPGGKATTSITGRVGQAAAGATGTRSRRRPASASAMRSILPPSPLAVVSLCRLGGIRAPPGGNITLAALPQGNNPAAARPAAFVPLGLRRAKWLSQSLGQDGEGVVVG